MTPFTREHAIALMRALIIGLVPDPCLEEVRGMTYRNESGQLRLTSMANQFYHALRQRGYTIDMTTGEIITNEECERRVMRIYGVSQ